VIRRRPTFFRSDACPGHRAALVPR
jgi:hypothetical protein